MGTTKESTPAEEAATTSVERWMWTLSTFEVSDGGLEALTKSAMGSTDGNHQTSWLFSHLLQAKSSWVVPIGSVWCINRFLRDIG